MLYLQHVQWPLFICLEAIYQFLQWWECASDPPPLLEVLDDMKLPLIFWDFQTVSTPPPLAPGNQSFLTSPPGSLWDLPLISSHLPPINMKVHFYPPSSLWDLFLISLHFPPRNLNLHLYPPSSLRDPWLVSSHFPPSNLHYHLFPLGNLWDIQLISLPHHRGSFQPLSHKHKPFPLLWHWCFQHCSTTSSIHSATS